MIVVGLVCILFLLHARSELVAIFVVPSSVLVSLLIMHLMGINANIMSLGGIAIAIGVVVDSAIIMVENAHKHLDREEERRARCAGDDASLAPAEARSSGGREGSRAEPVFQPAHHHRELPAGIRARRRERPAIQAAGVHQNLRDGGGGGSFDHDHPGADGLFHHRPRAAEAMGMEAEPAHHACGDVLPAGDALVLLADCPSLEPYRWWMRIGWAVFAAMLLVPQKIIHEERNPISRVLAGDLQAVLSRGDPVSLGRAARWRSHLSRRPSGHSGGSAANSCRRWTKAICSTCRRPIRASASPKPGSLQQTDKLIKTFPEVVSVYGKIGRADTATDPAPLDMIETVVRLQTDPDKWRKRKIEYCFDQLAGSAAHSGRCSTRSGRPSGRSRWKNWSTAGTMPTAPITPASTPLSRMPGVANAWPMPIENRTNMLSTGIKTPVGMKIMGPDLQVLGELAEQASTIMLNGPRHDQRLSRAHLSAAITSTSMSIARRPRATA